MESEAKTVRKLPTWRQMHMDTSPNAEAVLFKLWRETPTWRKLEIMEDLNRAARQMAIAGIRMRYPDDPPEKLRRRLADLLLGEELAERAYGPFPEE
jgi:hypothetical protein